MKILIDGLNIVYSEKVRLVKTLLKRESPEEHPEPLKWALQMLYFAGEQWVEICRIDNYIHQNQKGSHIHQYGKKGVRRVEIDYEDAEKAIKEMSERIIRERFRDHIEFGDE